MLKSTLSYKARWEFWNLWYIMIIINDILIICGSGIKERIERKVIYKLTNYYMYFYVMFNNNIFL